MQSAVAQKCLRPWCKGASDACRHFVHLSSYTVNKDEEPKKIGRKCKRQSKLSTVSDSEMNMLSFAWKTPLYPNIVTRSHVAASEYDEAEVAAIFGWRSDHTHEMGNGPNWWVAVRKAHMLHSRFLFMDPRRPWVTHGYPRQGYMIARRDAIGHLFEFSCMRVAFFEDLMALICASMALFGY